MTLQVLPFSAGEHPAMNGPFVIVRFSDRRHCVEVAHGERSVGLRDSKNPEGDRLAVTPRAWRSFLATVR